MTTITIDSDGWIKEAIGIYYPGRSWGAFTDKPRQIVMHGTATPGATAQDIANNWASTAGDASAHIIINKDGSFVQGLSLNWTAWANCCLTDNPNTGGMWDRRLKVGNQNRWAIAFEHCKNDAQQNSDILTPAQQATSFALTQAVCEYHDIPKEVIGYGDITNGGIIGHCNIDQLNRTYCPGPYPWQDLQNFLNGAPPMLIGWTDNVQTKILIAPGGIPVPEPYRTFLLDPKNAWNANNIPVRGVESRNPLEVSNPGLGAGTRLVCLWTTLEETGKGAFVAWSGKELLAVEQKLLQAKATNDAQLAHIQALESQIAALQQTPANISQATQQINAAQAALSQAIAALSTH